MQFFKKRIDRFDMTVADAIGLVVLYAVLIAASAYLVVNYGKPGFQ